MTPTRVRARLLPKTRREQSSPARTHVGVSKFRNDHLRLVGTYLPVFNSGMADHSETMRLMIELASPPTP